MQKTLFPIAVAVLLAIVVGCTSSTAPTPSTPTVEPTTPPTRPANTPAPPASGCFTVPPVSEEDWFTGTADAPITVVEYADFQ